MPDEASPAALAAAADALARAEAALAAAEADLGPTHNATTVTAQTEGVASAASAAAAAQGTAQGEEEEEDPTPESLAKAAVTLLGLDRQSEVAAVGAAGEGGDAEKLDLDDALRAANKRLAAARALREEARRLGAAVEGAEASLLLSREDGTFPWGRPPSPEPSVGAEADGEEVQSGTIIIRAKHAAKAVGPAEQAASVAAHLASPLKKGVLSLFSKPRGSGGGGVKTRAVAEGLTVSQGGRTVRGRPAFGPCSQRL